ncbi:MAG: GntR family transcriptional regulator [Polyangiaceae bacterium]
MLAITVDFDADIPVYRQIADGIRALIARGDLKHDDELPSVRQLGRNIGVNQNTVARAYRILADEGLVRMRQGQSVRVVIPDHAPESDSADEQEHRRLRDLISRWVLAGRDRAGIESIFADALDGFFDDPEKAGK